jgi:hypothetical protein
MKYLPYIWNMFLNILSCTWPILLVVFFVLTLARLIAWAHLIAGG